jgi:COP9 signalosome complex subunit 1
MQITPYVVKAESALDRPAPSTTSSSSVPLSAAQARAKEDELAKRELERSRVGTRLQVAKAISSLGQGMYERAAREFLAVEGELGDWGRSVRRLLPCES